MGSDDGDDHRFDHGRSFWSHDTSSFDLNSRLMLTAIISLSTVILLVVCLHLYARCVLRRRRAAFRGLPVVSRLVAQPPKRGLDPAVIASLPTFVVRRTEGQDGATSTDTECAVCLSVLEEEDTARVLPNCKHVFHVHCIDAWLGSRPTCPICRAEAEPRTRPEPEPREGPVSGARPSAPPLEQIRVGYTAEEASSSSGGKMGGSGSRLNSFRRILTRERSSNRINPCQGGQEDRIADVERC